MSSAKSTWRSDDFCAIQKAQAYFELERTLLEALRLSIPEGPGLDRLLRYEASLERTFDRTLNQLERLQRMRLGQPVVPPVNLMCGYRELQNELSYPSFLQ
jgi:hypothetical protein